MDATDSAHPVIILIGASNLTRGISSIVGAVQQIFRGPTNIVAALGHGRSYGLRSRVLMRELPPILECGLWRTLEGSRKQEFGKDAEAFALVTDIGNDIIYGQSVSTVVKWVENCLDRLQAVDARTIITQLPIESIRALPRWRFEIVRSVLYPSHHLRYEDAIKRAEALNDAIIHVADARGLEATPMDRAWYGFDPIHVRRSRERIACREILRGWKPEFAPPLPGVSLSRWFTLHLAAPERRWIFSREQHHPQPACRWGDGTTLSVF